MWGPHTRGGGEEATDGVGEMEISQLPPLHLLSLLLLLLLLQKPKQSAAAELTYEMASRFLLFSFLLLVALLHGARSDDTDTKLLDGINRYRASLNLSALTTNDNAACLADQIANQFKGQPCTNTTGSNTVPGTEEQFPNYPDFLGKCHLNATVTQDAAILPACVPNLDSALVLTNFTESQYSGSLNDTKYVGAGIANDGDWVVVVLSTDTPTGNFETTYTGVNSAVRVVFGFHLLPILGFLLVSWN